MSKKNKFILNLLCLTISLGFIVGLINAINAIVVNRYIQYKMFNLIGIVFQNNLTRATFYSTSVSIILCFCLYALWLMFVKKLRYDKRKVMRFQIITVMFFVTGLLIHYQLMKFRPYGFISVLTNFISQLKNLHSGETSAHFFLVLLKYNLVPAIFLSGIIIIIPILYQFLIKIKWGNIATKLTELRYINGIALAFLIILGVLHVYIDIETKSNRINRPNIIFIYLDALRPDHLGCYGYHRNTSTNIDYLAHSGVLFKNAFSQAPSTYPSVHTCLTSKYGHYFFEKQQKKIGLNNRYLSLPEILKNYGYYNVGISSSPVITKSETSAGLGGFGQGFDIFDDSICDGKEWNWQWRSPEGVIETAIRWLNRGYQKKFFLFLYIMDPHDAYHSPEPYNSLYDPGYIGKEAISEGRTFPYLSKILRGDTADLNDADIHHLKALYDGEIKYADVQIGKLLKHLRQLKLLDNTLIVLVSDHGEEFFEHEGLQHSNTLYNEVIKIPLIFYYPKFLPRGVTINKELVQSIDVVPTILDIINIDKPQGMQGESLLPLLKEGSEPWRDYAFSEAVFVDTKSIITKSWKYIHHFKTSLAMEGLSDKYTKNKLYNLKNDPLETHNVYASEPEIAKEFYLQMLSMLSDEERERLKKNKAIEFDHQAINTFKSLGYLQ